MGVREYEKDIGFDNGINEWTLQRTPGYMRVYKLTDSDKYCLNVEIVNNLTKIEPLNNYLMD